MDYIHSDLIWEMMELMNRRIEMSEKEKEGNMELLGKKCE